MNPSLHCAVSQSRRAVAVSAAAVLSCAVVTVGLAGEARAAAVGVPLGTAARFAVLAGAGVTNTGPTTLGGDLGSYPTTTTTGTGTLTTTGVNHHGDAVTQGAKTDLTTGYNTAAGEGPPHPVTADLAGQTLTAGVYRSGSSLGLTGAVTLDAGGNPNAAFVFQAGSTLTTGSASRVLLTNGAQACNVFWQVGSSATLGTGSTFRGSILALTDITVTTGVTIQGRVLARNGAVTLDTDTITTPSCASSAPPSSAPPSSAPPSKSPPPSAPPSSAPPSKSPPPSAPPSSAPPSKSPPPSAPPSSAPPSKSPPPSAPPAGGAPSGTSHSGPRPGTRGVAVAPGHQARTAFTRAAAALPPGVFFATPTGRDQQTGQAPVAGQMPATGQAPVAGQVPATGQVPVAGQVPGTGQVPVAGQVRQVRQVPVGAVHAGDGSTSPDTSPTPLLPVTALGLVTAIVSALIAVRRRQHRN